VQPRPQAPPPGYRYAPPPHPGAAPPRWAPPPVSPAGQPLAGFVDRLLAYLIDALILTAAALVVALPAVAILLLAFLPELSDETRADGTAPWSFILALIAVEIGILLLVLVAQYLYWVEYQLRQGGQTIGKRVAKVRVAPLDPAGTLTRAVLAKRYLVQSVAGAFVPFFFYLDGLWQLWDRPFQQCLHDKFAQTVVVKVNP
jgi:uncharacterized RDD family membrane protein YckC